MNTPKKILDVDVVILAGGFGTRLKSLIKDKPKCLAPVYGKPFIDILLDDLFSQGFERIILATGYLSEQLEYHVKQRVDAEYIISREPEPLGTGGAIKFAENHFCSDQVLVLNGDSHIIFHFPSLFKFHKNYRAEMSILLSTTTKGTEYGNVVLDFENRITSFSEKPSKGTSSFVNSGVYLINRKLLGSLKFEKQYSLEKECLPSWIQTHRIFGMLTNKAFLDIGTPERYISSQNISFED